MNDYDYMRRAIELAARGGGWTNPNPNVGAVIVKNGNIIGEGWHRKYGELHAERNAIAALTEDAEGATIYVTLEPCCHYGKTPPCTEAIIENKIAKVVIGSRDPNPKVAGKGAAVLREHGIEVVEDFLREECDKLNSIFFHYITTGRPYVAVKYAMTMDGKIATKTGASKWITGEDARGHVQKIRGRYNAIMAGIGTVLADDPMLNAREEGAHQPLRIILDTHLRIPEDSQIVRTAREYETLVVCGGIAKHASDAVGTQTAHEKSENLNLFQKRALLESAGVQVVEMPLLAGHINIRKLMEYLGSRKVDSVLIEGGGQVHEAAVRAGIVNHVFAYVAPKIFGGQDAKTPVEGEGVALLSDAAEFVFQKMTQLGEDILLEYESK